MRRASARAFSKTDISPLESWIIGTSAFKAATLAATLSPSASIASGEGPTKTMPSSRHRRAKTTFSDKNP